MSPLKIGRDLVRLRDVNVRLETWRIVIRETIFFFFFTKRIGYKVYSISS